MKPGNDFGRCRASPIGGCVSQSHRSRGCNDFPKASAGAHARSRWLCADPRPDVPRKGRK